MRCYLSLGTNLGDRLENLRKACHLLKQNGVRIEKVSSVYETSPWGIKEQPDFYNICLEISTDNPPEKLLEIIRNIEVIVGRRSQFERYGPRVIDIDIVFCEGNKVDKKELQIPHPKAHERPFVTIPLSEIAPELKLRGKKVSLLAVKHRKLKREGAVLKKVFLSKSLL